MSSRTVRNLTVFFLLLLIVLLLIFSRSQQSIRQAEAEALAIIEADYQVDNVNNFYWLITNDTYFSLDFTNASGKEMYAIIAQAGGEVTYYDHAELITEADALSLAKNYNDVEDFLNVRLGLLEELPVWEVTFRAPDQSMAYYYINAKNGEWVQTIGNL
ncbi:hypothetical protein CL176_07425 [Suicoccus acidiformans]|uniref:PepSY domain-containing protein n=1 Tax=Suicoccus acidiformans TaxID=2036206 RepID=A0A347WL83_9LACT|nr:PepSY domain-containing protein [Suicoccus acidiformans]AXY25840.1 hypothetical protein CL176_07425 [Suicoccus acidiformans]